MIVDDAKLASALEQLEEDLSLFDLEDHGVPIWERIRVDVFNTIGRRKGRGRAHSQTPRSLRTYSKAILDSIRNLFWNNPYLAGGATFLFFGHPRRKYNTDGYWWDIYCDPIHEQCSLETLHLEEPYHLQHRRPAKTPNLRYLDLIHYAAKCQRILVRDTRILNRHTSEALKSAEIELEDRFGIKLDLRTAATDNLKKRASLLWQYRLLLWRLSPKAVVLITSYGREVLIEACRESGIPTIELQHGVIYPQHLGYSYRGGRTKEMAPDYFFTFGEYWSEAVDLPLAKERVIPVGFPYLEAESAKYADAVPTEQILVISQATIGAELSRFAVQLSRDSRTDYRIKYKLHPGEYTRWKDEYPWLEESDVEVVESDEVPLYYLFATSMVQIGVGSTALFEGLYNGLETYVFGNNGTEPLEPLIESGFVVRVETVDEFVEYLGRGQSELDMEYIFRSGSIGRMCRLLTEIVEERKGSPISVEQTEVL